MARYGRYEVVCDIPPMQIVEATRALDGFEDAMDVRWEKLPYCEMCLVCGIKLKPGKWCFTYQSGDQVRYWLGRCKKHKTIFWREVK